MFISKDTYTLRFETIDNILRYFVKFKDSSGVLQEIEISQSAYLVFEKSLNKEKNLNLQDRRYKEHIALSDAELYERARNKPKTVDDIVFNTLLDKQLAKAIAELPKVMKRRFILYYGYGLTYKQIAKIENRNIPSIFESINSAKIKIREKMIFLKN